MNEREETSGVILHGPVAELRWKASHRRAFGQLATLLETGRDARSVALTAAELLTPLADDAWLSEFLLMAESRGPEGSLNDKRVSEWARGLLDHLRTADGVESPYTLAEVTAKFLIDSLDTALDLWSRMPPKAE